MTEFCGFLKICIVIYLEIVLYDTYIDTSIFNYWIQNKGYVCTRGPNYLDN